MGHHDLPADRLGVATLADEGEEDDIQAELDVGEREACSVGFGFTPDVRKAFTALRPIPKGRPVARAR